MRLATIGSTRVCGKHRVEHFKSKVVGFFLFFFHRPAQVCLSTSQPGSGAFYWGDAEVTLGFSLQTKRVFWLSPQSCDIKNGHYQRREARLFFFFIGLALKRVPVVSEKKK